MILVRLEITRALEAKSLTKLTRSKNTMSGERENLGIGDRGECKCVGESKGGCVRFCFGV